MDWRGNQGHCCAKADFHLLTIINNGEYKIAVSTVGECGINFHPTLGGDPFLYETKVFSFMGDPELFQESESKCIDRVLSQTRELANLAHMVEVKKYAKPETKTCLICGESAQVDKHRICDECREGVPCYICSLTLSCNYAFSGYNYDGRCVRYGVAVEGGSKVQYEALDRSEKAYWGFR